MTVVFSGFLRGLIPSSGKPSAVLAFAVQDAERNLQEYLAGTDPRDPSSALRFQSAAVSQDVVALGFTAVAGKSYSVLYRDSVGGGGWLKLKTFSPSATTARTEVTGGLLRARSEQCFRLVTPALP